MNFGNLRRGNGIKLKNLQLYVVARFGIHPTLLIVATKIRLQDPRAYYTVHLLGNYNLYPLVSRSGHCYPSLEMLRLGALVRLALLGANSSIRRCERLPSHSVNMPPSGMKEKNVWSEKVVEDYAGANRPIRKADCEGGDRRDSS
jgi:hypothetical protein